MLLGGRDGTVRALVGREVLSGVWLAGSALYRAQRADRIGVESGATADEVYEEPCSKTT